MSNFKAVPHTNELLSKIKSQRQKNVFDHIELNAFKALGVLFVFGIAVGIWTSVFASTAQVREFLALLINIFLLLIILTWGISQIVELTVALKTGFKPLTDAVDERIKREKEVISELAACNPVELRERAKHLELEAKFKTRRAAIGVAAVAVVVAIRQWFESAIKTGYLSDRADITLFLNSGAIGLSIGSVIVAIYAGRLERISGVLSLAADRSGK